MKKICPELTPEEEKQLQKERENKARKRAEMGQSRMPYPFSPFGPLFQLPPFIERSDPKENQ